MEDSIVLPIGQHYDQETLLPILHKLMKKEREVVAHLTEVEIKRGLCRAEKQHSFSQNMDVGRSEREQNTRHPK